MLLDADDAEPAQTWNADLLAGPQLIANDRGQGLHESVRLCFRQLGRLRQSLREGEFFSDYLRAGAVATREQQHAQPDAANPQIRAPHGEVLSSIEPHGVIGCSDLRLEWYLP